MLSAIEDTLGKTCLVALSYFDANEQPLKQSLLAGTVIASDKEQGITLKLHNQNKMADNNKKTPANKVAHLIIPADLCCWFSAPSGDFYTSNPDIKIIDPNFLVTWDIYQQNNKTVNEGEQQWWQWRPRTVQPVVG